MDVIIIATPDDTHYQTLLDAFELKPKLIICEKPIVTTDEQASNLISHMEKNEIKVIVNYTRRFVKQVEDLKNQITQNVFGKLMSGVGLYGKGIVHNGSHLLDLLNYFVGKYNRFIKYKEEYDFYEKDPTVSGVLFYGDVPLVLNGVNSEVVTVFELDMMFEKARIRITELGNKIEVYWAEPSDIYKGYVTHQLEEQINTEHKKALSNLYKHALEVLEQQVPIKCSDMDGITVFRQCNGLKEGKVI